MLILHEQSFCSAQDLVEEDYFNKCDGIGNCSEATNCIRQYSELESYILNNKDVVERITEAFYRTGKGVAKFIKITYRFQIPTPINDTNDTIEFEDFDNCSNHQTRYIWSESALYLLGPKPLFWFTLFAVNVPETSVTIDLPCLCDDTYDSLLSRLTYLVSTYRIAGFSSETFILANGLIR